MFQKWGFDRARSWLKKYEKPTEWGPKEKNPENEAQECESEARKREALKLFLGDQQDKVSVAALA